MWVQNATTFNSGASWTYGGTNYFGGQPAPVGGIAGSSPAMSQPNTSNYPKYRVATDHHVYTPYSDL